MGKKMVKFVTVDTRTLKGLKRAEWYHTHGWTMYAVGLTYVKFTKRSAK